MENIFIQGPAWHEDRANPSKYIAVIRGASLIFTNSFGKPSQRDGKLDDGWPESAEEHGTLVLLPKGVRST